jgi:kynurenine/2-aminoadipate aminotransferase
MEDDPYGMLSYGLAPAPANDADFKRPKSESFFSMDTEQRVLRFDSLSKTLSSGLRIGWATGPNALIRQLELHQQATSLHNSGISQALTLKLLTHLGPAGLDEQFRQVRRSRSFCCILNRFFIISASSRSRCSTVVVVMR